MDLVFGQKTEQQHSIVSLAGGKRIESEGKSKPISRVIVLPGRTGNTFIDCEYRQRKLSLVIIEAYLTVSSVVQCNSRHTTSTATHIFVPLQRKCKWKAIYGMCTSWRSLLRLHSILRIATDRLSRLIEFWYLIFTTLIIFLYIDIIL